jgi:hypothetical protein
MKTFFKTTGAVLVAGLALAACGSSSASSTGSTHVKSQSSNTQATRTYRPTLVGVTLPYGNKPTHAIIKFAQGKSWFVNEIRNTKDWRYSVTFGQHIFVGHYTKGAAYRYVRDSKIQAMDNNEFLGLVLSKSTKWPHGVVDHFNFVRYGQFGGTTVSQINAAIQWQTRHHFNPARLNVPHEATIIESPVGKLAPPNSSHRVPGACIPSPAELLGSNGHPATDDPYNALISNYTIQYSGLNGNLYSHGTPYQTSNCAKALSGVK